MGETQTQRYAHSHVPPPGTRISWTFVVCNQDLAMTDGYIFAQGTLYAPQFCFL